MLIPSLKMEESRNSSLCSGPWPKVLLCITFLTSNIEKNPNAIYLSLVHLPYDIESLSKLRCMTRLNKVKLSKYVACLP